jgi:hypothetical protein
MKNRKTPYKKNGCKNITKHNLKQILDLKLEDTS